MSDLYFKSPIEQEFFDLIKDLDIDDWKEIRDESYWWEECPFTGKLEPRQRSSKLVLISYYVQHGIRKL
jgi:hypothetical protein|tara:strand:- start:215 stop:421 length:207 start_codon:yes stop_codon:yes gene_type:complete